MRGPLQHLISGALLVGMLAPSAATLGVGLHLASGHHGFSDPHGGAHLREITDLVVAATHGHHHDLDTAPHHHHYARPDGPASAFRSALPLITLLSTFPSVSAAPAWQPPPDGSWRRGPPTALFTANCSLLL